jgi:transcriptional regulator with XRE-family HTH domain
MRHVANNIKQIREEKGMTLREAADIAGVAFGYLDDIENGKANPSLEELEQITHALGKIDLHDILERHEHGFEEFGQEYGDRSEHDTEKKSSKASSFSKRSWD